MELTPNKVVRAQNRLKSVLTPTPLLRSNVLDSLVGGRVWLKAESLQGIGSFKIRGAYNALAAAGNQRRSAGVVAGSSGNHAQGIAQAARWLGCPARIVMPTDAPIGKRAAVEALGAEIIDYDRYRQDREQICKQLAEASGALMISAYDHPDVIAGQGTVGLEIMQSDVFAQAAPDQVLVCCGGGGLTAGVSLAVHAHAPETHIIAVEPAQANDTQRSFSAGVRVALDGVPNSICDALLPPMPGKLTFPIMQQHLRKVVTVSDDEALYAVGFAYRCLRLLLEPGGAVALAAVLFNKVTLEGKSTVAILSGGNIDDAMLARALRYFDKASE
ncbi:MAG: threonine/serine dehydratase [Pseudomonadota bacterium]